MAKLTRGEIVERERKAIEFRLAGMSMSGIGRELAVTHQMASRIIDQGLRRSLREPADKLREIELRRLDRMQQAMWEKGVVQKNTTAILRLLQISQRRAEMLGLDAPKQIEITEPPEDRANRLADDLRAFLAGARARQQVDEKEAAVATIHPNGGAY